MPQSMSNFSRKGKWSTRTIIVGGFAALLSISFAMNMLFERSKSEFRSSSQSISYLKSALRSVEKFEQEITQARQPQIASSAVEEHGAAPRPTTDDQQSADPEPGRRSADEIEKHIDSRLDELRSTLGQLASYQRRAPARALADRSATSRQSQTADGIINGLYQSANELKTYISAASSEAIDRQNSIFESAVQSGQWVVLASLAFGLLAIMLIFWRAVRPLWSLTHAMELLAGGRLSEEIPYLNRNDEIGQMARATQVFKEAMEEIGSAHEIAEVSSRAKADFLAVMSHEIRTPMNAVVGLADLLSHEVLSEDQKETVLTIRQSTQALLSLIDNVLDVSKLEEGAFTLERMDFNIVDVVEDVGELFAFQASEKGIDLIIDIDPGVQENRIGDPVRLRQIVSNLVVNAVKFTERGRVVIRLAPEADDRVMISVTDSGIGMTEEQKNRLFKPFTQADTSTARRYGGTGLGLAISRGLIEMMGSQIVLQSNVNVGSTFSFCVALPVSEPNVSHGALFGKRVALLARDEFRKSMLAHALVAGGASVRFVEDAAGKDFSFAPGELFLMDMGGADAAASTRSNQLQPPAVIVTSRNSPARAAATEPLRKSILMMSPFRRSRLWSALLDASTSEHLVKRRLDVRNAAAQNDRMFDWIAPDHQTALAAGALILVAEDNNTNRRVILRLLTRLGYTAECVVDGEEALLALSEKPYGMLIADCHMPRLDGFGLAARIRASEAHSPWRLPIVALTADALAGTASRCRESGMDDYLTKPVTLDRLDAVVQRWLPAAADLRGCPAPVEQIAPPLLAPTPVASPPLVMPRENESPPDYVRDMTTEERHSFLSEFFEDMKFLIKDLMNCIETRDAEGAFQAAHAIKGAAANVGENEIAIASGKIESLCGKKDLMGAADLLVTLVRHRDHGLMLLSSTSLLADVGQVR